MCMMPVHNYLFYFNQGTPELDEESYDRCFNAACSLIGQGDYTTADTYLKKAEGKIKSLNVYNND